MLKSKKNFRKTVASLVAAGMIAGMASDIYAIVPHAATAQIVVDYNTSIGTGTKYIFGGAGTPSTDEQTAWSSLSSEMGVKLIKIPIDLARLYPNADGSIDSDVKEEYLHVASGQLTRAKGAGMEVMLEFINLPAWLDENNDAKYDDEAKYTAMIKEFLTEASGYNDIIKFIEIAPPTSLNANDFVDVYYATAKAIRSLGSNYTIGGPGYTLQNKNDTSLGKIRDLLTRYKTEEDKSLLQFISLRGYGVNAVQESNDYFGEFKEGRKNIRNWSGNADLPLFMTGWTTVSKEATTPDNNVTGAQGIQQQAVALFKAMRDGWNAVLFNSTTSDKNSPSSYTYKVKNESEVTLNPFAKAWNLLSNKLKLGSGDFKVVSTDMGSNWVVDDSIAMVNNENEAIILATNFSNEKTDVTVEMKNVPYEDGEVTLECYVAKEGVDGGIPYATVSANVVNGIINSTIPSIPSNGATGIVVKGGVHKNLPAQSIYEFESQDNHFGGNTEISWRTGASFNRVVRNFGGENNFVTLKNVVADGSGTYTAKLYAGSGNSNIKVSVNNGEAITVNGNSASISNPVEFDIDLEAGNNNTIKVWTGSGELNPDRLVLVAKNVRLSIGFQNLNTLSSIGQGESKQYILPLSRNDFKVDGRIFPESASGSNSIEYSSSNEEVVTVNNEGLLTPITNGEATITAKIAGRDDVSNSFNLVVKNSVSGITVNPKSLTVKPGETAAITSSLTPADAENKEVIWTSSNPAVVEIISSSNDVATVKAVGENGNSIITARTVDGGYEATSSITVIKPEEAGNVNIDYSNTIADGSSSIFGVTHYPSINKNDSDVGDHSKVWEMLRDDMGVKFMRADARLQEILPIWTKTPDTNWAANSNVEPGQPTYVEADYYYVTGPDGVDRQFSVEGYREDMEHFEATGEYLNGMSNPENWNTDRLMSWVTKAKEMGFEVMVMTFQIPEWLASGYPLPGAPHTEKACNSAPKDWEIFRDIVKKVYTMLRPYADYYELLNEPHWYVPQGGDQRRPDGTAYPSSNKVNLIAADTMYQAIDAMYEAEREITGDSNAKPVMQLGGGSDDSWGGNYGVLGTLFSDEYADWHDRIEFVSIHKYGTRPANQDNSNGGANSRNLKYWLREKTGKDMPIFLNEYNASTGQPHEYHTGAKSMAYHGRILTDMMLDGYTGGGYYTCYPSDVPMDDYEASSGWVERGKGVYAWNNGDPTLATFTKTWNLLSVKLGLGKGDFKVKSTEIKDSKVTDGIGAINSDGKPVAFLTNFSGSSYGQVSVKMNNVPYAAGSKVTAKIYAMTTDSSIDMEPVTVEVTVSEDSSIDVIVDEVGSNGVVGILVEGEEIQINDKTFEFESYLNKFEGSAKVEVEGAASNGRWLNKIAGGSANSVTTSIAAGKTENYEAIISYRSGSDAELTYVVNDGEAKTVSLPATSGISTVTIEIPLTSGENTVKFYNDGAEEIQLDKLDIPALEAGVTVVDKDQLQGLVDSNKDKVEDKYTVESWAVFAEALANAEAVLADEEATQEDVEAAKERLVAAVDGLVEISTVNKKELQIAVEEAEKVTEDELSKVVPAVVEEFKAALAEAKEILANEGATQDEVNGSFNRLSDVMHMLSFQKGDKTFLISLVERINGLNSEEYIKSTWDKLAKALEVANGVIADENAMEEEVSETYTELLKAFLELRLKPNKDKLEDLINKVEALDKDKYTEESWSKVEEKLEAAKAVMNNDEATEDEVKKSVEELEIAMNSLVEKPSDNNNNNGDGGNGNGSGNGGSGNNGSGNSNGSGNNTEKPGQGNLPQTGQESNILLYAIILVIAGSAVLITKKKVNRN